MTKEYTVEKAWDGVSVKTYLRTALGLSAKALKKVKYGGSISVNGTDCNVTHLLAAGDRLILRFPEERSETVLPVPMALDVLYEDGDVLAVNKPSGMPVHPSLHHFTDTLANAVLYYYRETPFVYRPLTRLDADTTGVVLIAKNALFAAAWEKCGARKTYLAETVGVPEPPSGVIRAPIARAEGIIKRCVSADGKPSETRYRTLAERDGNALVECVLITGRTHQIRVHMASVGCPLRGDYLYGTEIPGERTHLHCAEVSFSRLGDGERMTVKAPLPQDFLWDLH